MTEREVRAIVREELRRMFARLMLDDRTYSTRAGCEPEGYSRDGWRSLARRIGVKRGRYWYVDAATLDAYEHGERSPKPPSPAPASRWTPADAARAVGLRAVDGGKR